MSRELLVFAALAGTPASAFICRAEHLALFSIFPLAGLVAGGAGYLRRLVLLALPPAVSLAWGLLKAPEAVAPSLRWLAAAAPGSYFAWVLGAGGAAMVLRGACERFRFLRRPLEPVVATLLFAGPCAELTRRTWAETRGTRPFADRMAEVAGRVLNQVGPCERNAHVAVPHVVLAGMGWAVLTLSVAGIL